MAWAGMWVRQGFASYMLVDNGEPKPIVKTCQDFKSEGS